MSNQDYVSVVYNENRSPKTDYPSQLAAYLCQRFALPPGSKFLEVGCGRGDFLRAFHRAGLQCNAVDQSHTAAKFIRGELDIRIADVSKEPLPYGDGSFDTVYSKSLLEHMWDPTFLMSEMLRVLRPGGICIILTPDWVSQVATFYEDYTHCRPYTVDSLRDLMMVSGFNNVGAELFRQHPLIWGHPSHRWLAVLLGCLLSTRLARKLTQVTGIKFFRWAVELMVLGYGYK